MGLASKKIVNKKNIKLGHVSKSEATTAIRNILIKDEKVYVGPDGERPIVEVLNIINISFYGISVNFSGEKPRITKITRFNKRLKTKEKNWLRRNINSLSAINLQKIIKKDKGFRQAVAKEVLRKRKIANIHF